MVQKKFMDIERIKGNYGLGFRKGDLVQISEKFDGSNASVRYDPETDSLVAFSRRMTLDGMNTLNGFWNYVQTLKKEDYKEHPNYVIFGEWAVKNAITYYPESMKKWYVYDIYDVVFQRYLPQSEVKRFAEEHNLTYIHVFYDGEFIDWDHVQSFVGKSVYGEHGEGVVVKNQSRLNDPNCRMPFVVKIVGEKFQEVQKSNHIRKMEDPHKLKEKESAMQLVESVVTKRRVEKELYKMRDEGLIPDLWDAKNMHIIAQSLPRRIFNDCVKEENETVMAAGEHFGKFCASAAMRFAREIVLK